MIEGTVSIGVATSEPDRESLDVRRQLERADRALYDAKLNGRNRVVVANAEGGDSVRRGARPH